MTTLASGGTATDEPGSVQIARMNSLGTVLTRSRARYGTKLAVIDGETRLTYNQFDDRASAFAATLQRAGLQPGDRIAVLSRNCWEFAALAWGCARGGYILVPFNFMLKPEELAFLIDDADVAALFAGPGLLGSAAQSIVSSRTTPQVRVAFRVDADAPTADWISLADWLEPAPEGWEAPHVEDDAPIRIMYTSGTESQPKGALLSSRALIAEYVSCIVDGAMSADDVDLHTLPLYHCAQLDCFLGPDLMLGATSIMLPSPDPTGVLTAIQEHGVTKYFAPPTVWISLLRSPNFDSADLSSLKKGYYGASPMPKEILREMLDRLPSLQLWNFYGQTEIAPVATILPPHEQLEFAGSAGRPVLNVETRVIDEQGGQLPAMSVGEVVHRTPQAALGYWRNPAKTEEAFAGGWFHSGDLGFMDQAGRLTIVDRKKDMIKSGGENVASREVEEVMYLHPDVTEVAVFATPDPKWIEVVTAAVVIRTDSHITDGDLIEHCRRSLAGFKCPKHVYLVQELPKNPSGKILKRVLRERFTA